jgi:flagellar hook-associated protein 3 FlgL
MRIATAYAYESSLDSLQRRQAALTRAQEQLTSGKRVLKPSDDPAAAAQAERALASVTRSEGHQRALDASKDAMQLTESSLAAGGELLQQVREHLISAGNGSYSDNERATLAETMRGLRTDLLIVANRSDGAGRYLFGGQGSDNPPFVDGVGGVTYNAATGHMQAATGDGSPLTVDGQVAWLQAPDTTNPGTTLSIFDVLDTAITELLTPGRTATQISNTVNAGMVGVDAGMGSLSAWRSRAGEALNRIDGLSDRLSQIKLDGQRLRSDAEDLDMLQAISDFQSRQTGYDAALKTFATVQKMSLFDYVR